MIFNWLKKIKMFRRKAAPPVYQTFFQKISVETSSPVKHECENYKLAMLTKFKSMSVIEVVNILDQISFKLYRPTMQIIWWKVRYDIAEHFIDDDVDF